MNNRWSKENPVSLSELLKISPVANEILCLADEFGVSVNELLWTVYQIVENLQDSEEFSAENFMEALADFDDSEDYEQMELTDEVSIDDNKYTVSFDIIGGDKLPQVSLKVGINNKEDIGFIFEMIAEMIEKI